jgi:hypothetical protein
VGRAASRRREGKRESHEYRNQAPPHAFVESHVFTEAPGARRDTPRRMLTAVASCTGGPPAPGTRRHVARAGVVARERPAGVRRWLRAGRPLGSLAGIHAGRRTIRISGARGRHPAAGEDAVALASSPGFDRCHETGRSGQVQVSRMRYSSLTKGRSAADRCQVHATRIALPPPGARI